MFIFITVVLVFVSTSTTGLVASEVKGCDSEIFNKTVILVCGPQTIRVWRGNQPPTSNSLIVERSFTKPTYTRGTDFVETKNLRVDVNISINKVTITNKVTGFIELEEETYELYKLSSKFYNVKQSFKLKQDELIYGGGQLINYNNIDITNIPVRLHHSKVSSPNIYFTSSEGYGLLWDSNSKTFINERATMDLNETNECIFTTKRDGFHSFEAVTSENTYSQKRYLLRLMVSCSDNSSFIVMNWNSSIMIPHALSGRTHFIKKNTSCIAKLSLSPPQSIVLYHNIPETRNLFTIESNTTEGLSYYFHGGFQTAGMTSAVTGYQYLTGIEVKRPMWSLGYLQSKNTYLSQNLLMQSVTSHRSLSIPLDGIVQGQGYWGNDANWGPQWDPSTFPNPVNMTKYLHQQNVNLIVSSWVNYSLSTVFAAGLQNVDGFLPNQSFYDPFNKNARRVVSSFILNNIISKNVDAIWIDGNSPFGINDLPETQLGPGPVYENAYPLLSNMAMNGICGQRQLLLSSSGFSGIQRVGGCLLGNNVEANWDTLRQDVVTSLAVQSSGMSCWSTAVGGYYRPSECSDINQYCDLLVRWFQFAAFTPVMRNHALGDNELWLYGNETQSLIVKSALTIRYQLLPYTYSNLGTALQRPLVFDYGIDSTATSITDQFMFGPSLLIAPILSPSGSRRVYLPFNFGGWFDFYSGLCSFFFFFFIIQNLLKKSQN